MNQSCFTLGFLSQNSLSKFSLSIMGMKGIYTGVRRECETSSFSKQRWLMAWSRDLTKSWESRDNRMASCPVLSCSALASMTVHLLASLARVLHLATAASHPQDQAASLCFLTHSWAINTLSHSLPLQQTHLNTGLLNAEIQANLARNKANKMID